MSDECDFNNDTTTAATKNDNRENVNENNGR